MLNRYDKWTSALPGVQPFYAVKCNPDRAIIKTLAALGAGFDCASMVNAYSFILCIREYYYCGNFRVVKFLWFSLISYYP